METKIDLKEEIIDIILIKINENKKEKFTKEDLIRFIEDLDSKFFELNEKEIFSLLKSDEKVDVKNMIHVIVNAFQDTKENKENRIK